MENVDSAVIEQFVAACRKVGRMELVRGTSGNLSLRLDGERMLISATRTWLADMTSEGVALCSIADGRPLSERRPSVEINFHAGILRRRPDVAVVLHFQSDAATTCACFDPPVGDYNVTPEIPVYIGDVADVPYLPPGSRELADAVVAAVDSADLAQMRNHGQVVVGPTLNDAVERAAFFEMVCRILLDGGERVRPLSAEAVANLSRMRQA